MYRYSLILLLFIITSCNAGRLTLVKHDQTIVSEEQIAKIKSNSEEKATPSIRPVEESEKIATLVEEESISSDHIQIEGETTNDYSDVISFPVTVEDSITKTDEVPDEIKTSQALRSERLAGAAAVSSSLAILSIPLSIVTAFAFSTGILSLLILLIGLVLFIVGWITFGSSLRSRFTTRKARNLRVLAGTMLILYSLIVLISILAVFF